MYNLLMVSSSSQDEWELNQGRLYDVSFLKDRVFEYTDDGIEQQFIGDDGPDFDELRKLPCLFTYEGIDVVGSIGTITEVKPRNRRLEIHYTLPVIYPKLRLVGDSVFQALGIGTQSYGERSRTHWAVKDVDLFEVTTRMLHAARNIPVVLSQEDMNRIWGDRHQGKKLVFLSHRATHRGLVAAVREQLERQRLSCFVAHQDVTPSKIWHDEILNALNTMDAFVGLVTDDFHDGGWTDHEVGYACHRGVPRVFVKLERRDPVGMVAREQALTTTWERAGQEIIAHLRQIGVLQ